MATLFYKHKTIPNKEIRAKRILWGSLSATLVLTFIFMTLGKSNSDDFRWLILPYIFVPISGAAGGWLFHVLDPMRSQGGIVGFAAYFLGGIVFCVLFIAAFVLGMNGPD